MPAGLCKVLHKLLGSQPISGIQLSWKRGVLALATLLCADRPQGSRKRCFEAPQRKRHGPCVVLHSQLDLGCDQFREPLHFPWRLKLSEKFYRFSLDSVNTETFGNAWGHGRGDAGEALVAAGHAGPCKQEGHPSLCSIPSAQQVLSEEMSTDNTSGGEPREVFWGSMMAGCGGELSSSHPTVPTSWLVVSQGQKPIILNLLKLSLSLMG